MGTSSLHGHPLSLVGRDREREILRDLLDGVLAGNGSLALISGEAGIGKTALAEEALRHAEHQGALILTGGCYHLTTTPPPRTLFELLRNYPSTYYLAVLQDPLLIMPSTIESETAPGAA